MGELGIETSDIVLLDHQHLLERYNDWDSNLQHSTASLADLKDYKRGATKEYLSNIWSDEDAPETSTEMTPVKREASTSEANLDTSDLDNKEREDTMSSFGNNETTIDPVDYE